jgi:hypothetical protein
LVVVVVGSARIVRKFVDDILGAPPGNQHLVHLEMDVSSSKPYPGAVQFQFSEFISQKGTLTHKVGTFASPHAGKNTYQQMPE